MKAFCLQEPSQTFVLFRQCRRKISRAIDKLTILNLSLQRGTTLSSQLPLPTHERIRTVLDQDTMTATCGKPEAACMKLTLLSSATRRLRLKSVWSITQHGEILPESFLAHFKKKIFFGDVEFGGGGVNSTYQNKMTRRPHVAQAVDEEIHSRAKSHKTKWQPPYRYNGCPHIRKPKWLLSRAQMRYYLLGCQYTNNTYTDSRPHQSLSANQNALCTPALNLA